MPCKAMAHKPQVIVDVCTGCEKSLCFSLPPLLDEKLDINITVSPKGYVRTQNLPKDTGGGGACKP